MQKTRPESETGPAYPIASVNNALLLLLLFREQPRVRLTDACKYLGVAHSTAHRLLAMLAHHGFVQQEPVTRAYIAGPALVEVGLAVVGSLNVREQARPAMEELAAETGETVHLGALEGNQVRYVDGLESERALRVVARTGTLAPAHCTSLGKALLAQMTDEQVCGLYPASAEPFPARTDRSITTQAKTVEGSGQGQSAGLCGQLGRDRGGRGFGGRRLPRLRGTARRHRGGRADEPPQPATHFAHRRVDDRDDLPNADVARRRSGTRGLSTSTRTEEARGRGREHDDGQQYKGRLDSQHA